MNLYYKIWVDFILKARSIPANRNNWKRFTFGFMGIAMAINFACIISIFQKIIGVYFYHFKVDLFPGESLDTFISGFGLFVLPMFLLNYFLIFRGKQYERLIKKYKSYNGKLFAIYFFVSLTIPLLILIWSQII